MNDIAIKLKVLSPWKVIWEGDVVAISGTNNDGVFDVLPDHERFVTIVSIAPIEIVTTAKERLTFSFKEALLVCADNVANIYTTDVAANLNTE